MIKLTEKGKEVYKEFGYTELIELIVDQKFINGYRNFIYTFKDCDVILASNPIELKALVDLSLITIE